MLTESETTMKDSYFEQVYEKTHRSLIRYAIVHLDDPTDAEDALQNVYVDFYRRIQQYGHFDILSPEAFLIKMLKRQAGVGTASFWCRRLSFCRRYCAWNHGLLRGCLCYDRLIFYES